MASDKAVVRFARRQDVPSILALIRELADYEKALDEVEATEEKLLQTLAFAPSDTATSTESTSATRPARCLLLITPDGETTGIALYFYNYSTWRARPGVYLEDLYVRPTHRKKGYGRLLLETLARETVAMGGGRFEWSVLNWNTPSIQFYESLGAKRMSDWSVMRVDGDALVKLAGDK